MFSTRLTIGLLACLLLFGSAAAGPPGGPLRTRAPDTARVDPRMDAALALLEVRMAGMDLDKRRRAASAKMFGNGRSSVWGTSYGSRSSALGLSTQHHAHVSGSYKAHLSGIRGSYRDERSVTLGLSTRRHASIWGTAAAGHASIRGRSRPVRPVSWAPSTLGRSSISGSYRSNRSSIRR